MKHKKRKTADSDSDSETSENNDNSGGKPKAKTGAEWIIELQALHACSEHNDEHCIIRPNGTHHHLTKQDFSLWGLLLVHNLLLLFELCAHCS
jgi:hypothetical protein